MVRSKTDTEKAAEKAAGANTTEKKRNTENAIRMEKTAAQPPAGFPIVGLGASAGGLAAFETFFSGMPSDKNPDMAFVLVQHLAPDHKSILTDLIRRYTRMQVFEVEDGVVVQPNCVYIIPPNHDMALLNGMLNLLEPKVPRGQRLPIDFFFRSLAQDLHERAICIVLSGTGSDGTLGIRAIKGEGGMAMAQVPESTEFDGMPRSAIETGLVDYILPPDEMAANLIAYASQSLGLNARSSLVSPKSDGFLNKIFILLRSQTGHDFSMYKRNTVNRRIERRMAVHQIADLGSYTVFLQRTPVEVEALFRDLLIGVTNFFRDPAAFAELEAKVIPSLFADKPDSATIRVWTCGCSTGEEAYSIAILLQEQMEKLKRTYNLQLFATDIDSRAIDQARRGLYPASICADVSRERLARYFTIQPDGSAYRINKGIRDLLVFSEHDVIKDPPFSRLDLISCRNMLIYMGSELQKKLIPLFHYALNPGGVLFLGTSETIGDYVQLFSTLNGHSKLYSRKEDLPNTQRLPPRRFFPLLKVDSQTHKLSGLLSGEVKISLRVTAERTLLERYTPASVVVSERGEILYIHGDTGRYLKLASGEPEMNILKMAREGLKRDLTTALHSVVKDKKQVDRPNLRVESNGDFSTIDLTVLPVPPTADSITDLTLYLVVLKETRASGQNPPKSISAVEGVIEKTVDSDEELTTSLKQELRAKEEYLKSVNEELETSNEELRSVNEEMQSINEELQSANEELETSKEELQSVNEELATVNTELQTKVFDLSQANNDMNNLLAGTGVGTVFVDFKLLIQRFTPSITQLINLIPSDVGRPVGHIVSNIVGYDTLVEDINAVLECLIPKEVEVQTREGMWFLMRIRPYRTIDNVIEGAVITFFDISEIKIMRDALQKANEESRLAVVVRNSHDAILLQDLEGRILAWNPASEKIYGWKEAEALGRNIREIIPEGLREDAITRIQQLCRDERLVPYRSQRIAKDGTVLEVWLTATALLNDAGLVYAIATTERACRINDV